MDEIIWMWQSPRVCAETCKNVASYVVHVEVRCVKTIEEVHDGSHDGHMWFLGYTMIKHTSVILA